MAKQQVEAFQPAKFTPGDVIEWDSQAAGGWKTKKGKILAIIKVNESAIKLAKKHAHEGAKLMGQSVSLVPRYLVAVPRVTATGKLSTKTDLYTPSFAVVHKNGRKLDA